ncbi:hypothetical protein LNKW23_24070 [Paralimibaculum aggregatum]|uniref:DUF4214 domain-containing protein n=1 Tax=Paralimibaculum aggregatum TaxID=3036245 RepID=A0ABQ6LIV6_9RHOB|nr:DUF4214 domain-containing protein [Limibaculum sp. NKW23]GMG83194.1 hypothetical protein LNKW23_24070 [Limibaculum sp. NKW23]
MTFDIRIDYRFDSTGFFDDPAVRAAMETAAALWEAVILDEFDDVPAGISFDVTDPSNRGAVRTVTLDAPIDDLVVFVGAAPLTGELGLAGPTGTSLDGFGLGDPLDLRVASDFRGQGPATDFEPWAGSITFEPDGNWSFATDGPVPGMNDFVTTAAHEIGHVLGIGTAEIYRVMGAGGAAAGPNAVALVGAGGVPLDASLHVADGFAGDSVLMDPITITGTAKTVTEIDKALLADIGYEILGFDTQGAPFPLATEGADVPLLGTAAADMLAALGGDDLVDGNAGDDTIDGGAGNDQLQGNAGADEIDGGAGDDTIFGGAGGDLLRGGPGTDIVLLEGGADIFAVAPGDGSASLQDFDLGADLIRVSTGFGFADPAAVLATASKPFSNLTRLQLDAGTSVDILHAPQDGTPLTAAMLEIASVGGSDAITGTPGSDPALIGTGGADLIEALSGDDVIFSTTGDDTIEGGQGDDRAVYAGTSATHLPSLGGDGTVTLTTPEGTDQLRDVERIDLEDGDYLYDLALGTEAVESGYRLYSAGFARTPDEGGLRFWVDALASGAVSFAQAAGFFIDSLEFEESYGVSGADLRADDPAQAVIDTYIDALYVNVLGRGPDDGGRTFWTDAFAAGTAPEALLVFFADSTENVERTQPLVENGVFVLADDLLV